MVLGTALRRNRSRTAMRIKALRSRTARILRYRSARTTELGRNRTLRLALGERRHRRHGRTRGTGRNRRLAVFVTATEADIGEALQQRSALLRRMLVGGFTAGLPDLVLGRHRKFIELRHARRTHRHPLRLLRNEGRWGSCFL